MPAVGHARGKALAATHLAVLKVLQRWISEHCSARVVCVLVSSMAVACSKALTAMHFTVVKMP